MKKYSKFVIIISIALAIYTAFGYLYIQQNTKTLTEQKYKETVKEMQSTLATLIKEKKEAIRLISLSLSHNKDLKNSLIMNDPNSLSLDTLSNFLKVNSTLKNVWFQILTKNGVSFYRSWTSKRGDSLVKARIDVAEMIKNHKIISSISTGKFDMTFKTMVPIFNKQQEFIGSIETIAKFNSIAIKMQKYGNKILILADKSYKKQLTKAFTKQFIGDYYVANLNPDKAVVNKFKKDIHHTLLHTQGYIVDNNESLLFTTYHLLDLNKKEMGYFLLAKNLNAIDTKNIEASNKKIMYTFVIILLIIIGFSYYIYMIKYQGFIEKHNKKLEEDVQVRTKELYYMAHHDSLTNLPNRALFLERLNDSLKHFFRSDANTFVLFLDLDNFKDVNDIYGHDIGDELLKEVALRLKNILREEDTVARLGGDEFTIIINQVYYTQMVTIAEKIIKHMEEIFDVHSIKLHTTFSIGISSYPNDSKTAAELLKQADTAMYEAKKRGKNNFHFYNKKMSKLLIEKITLENEINSALENDEFKVYFQPKMNAVTNKLIGIEALIRWKHPIKGIVFPSDFIPFAAEVGLLAHIDEYMRKNILKITKGWIDKGMDFGQVSFNASSVDLHNDMYAENLRYYIEEMDYDARKLELEILESQSMKEQDKVIAVLNKIRKLGVSITVDDFGTGYSSLSYVKKLPIDKLKIDRSFVEDLPNNKDSVAIVKTIIALAQNLNLEIIAEGVETKEQLDFLVNNGCENIQGYYYSKPISEQEFENIYLKEKVQL